MTTSKRKPEDNPEMRVLKTATCKSTSGKSTLTYQIGCTPDKKIYIRISNNSGNGFVNKIWIAIQDIQRVLVKGPKGQPLNSLLLQPLFEGRSSNSAGFYMAALSNERLLRVLKGKKRGHEFLDPEGFDARMDRLVSSKAGGTAKTAKKKTVRKTGGKTGRATPRKTTAASTKKAAIKKKAAARKKQRKVS